MNIKKMLVSGCSFSAGYGMPDGPADKRNWPNLLANKLKVDTIDNVSQPGTSNSWIFLETISAMMRDNYDLVIVQWSAIPRFSFKVGLELYSVNTMLETDVNIVNHQTISKEWLKEIKHRLLKLHNDHWDLLDLVKYVNVLIELQVRSRKGKIFFVNGLGPWPDQYFNKKQIVLPSDLDHFTQNLLQVDLRDDDEIFKLYDMIHSHYSEYGGIQDQYWLNLYQPMLKLMIDTINPDDKHPGYGSQQLFADCFEQEIKNRISNFNPTLGSN